MINSIQQLLRKNNLKNLKFLWSLFITIILLPNLVLAASVQDNARGTFYDDFTDNSDIALAGNTEFDANQTNIRLSDDNTASILFRGQNGSMVYQANIKDNYLYVAACAAGLMIYDLSDPTNPSLVGQYNTPGCVQDIDFYGNYALLSDQYNSDEGVQPPLAHQGGLQIVDISDPANPTFVSSMNTATGTFSDGVKAIGHYAYASTITTTQTGSLDIYDISNISSPQLVNSISKPYSFRWRTGVVDGNYLYSAANNPAGQRGLHIFNISDPINPIEVGSYITGGAAYAPVSKVGNYVYLPTTQTGVLIIDVSNVANPILVATVDTPDSAGNVVVSGGYGYVADRYSGLQIFDTTTHAIVGSYNTPDQAYDVDFYGDYAYMADSSSIQVINISDPTNPTLTKEVKSYIFGNYFGLAVSGNYVYVAHSSGMAIFDPSNPYTPSAVGGVYLSSSALGVAVSGNYAYVANGADGLKVINVSDKVNPTTTGSLDTSGTANKVAVSGNYAYVADGASGLQVIDISVPASPTSTTTLATAHYAYGVDLYDNYILSAEGTAGFRIVDITDPTNPVVTATIDTPGTTQRVVASGNYAYVADTTSFRIYDISTIAAPVLKGTIATTNTNSVAVMSSSFIAASSPSYNGGPSSVYLTIDVSDPTSPSVVDSKDTVGGSNFVAVSGDYVYAADGDSGLAVFSHGFTAGDSGRVNSSTITPLEFDSWDRIVVNNTLNDQTISYQVLDSVGAPIQEGDLPGNNTSLPNGLLGFLATDDSTTIDISGLSKATYPALKLKAYLFTASGLYTPTIDAWKVYWIKAAASGDTTSNASGYVLLDAVSSIGDDYTCAWDVDVSDGVDWNNPNSANCRENYNYSSKGNGAYTVTLRIHQGGNIAYDQDTRAVTVQITDEGGWNPEPIVGPITPKPRIPGPITPKPRIPGPITPEPIRLRPGRLIPISQIPEKNPLLVLAPEEPQYLNLSVEPRILLTESTAQSLISAQILNKENGKVADGTIVNWEFICPDPPASFKDFSCGTLSASQSSSMGGTASIIFTPGQLPGLMTIKGCTTNNICVEKTIKVALKQRGKIVLNANYSSMPADGKSKIKIYIKAYDRYLAPWPNAVVSLQLLGLDTDQKDTGSIGGLSLTEIKTDKNGEAVIYYSVGEKTGKIKIKASLEGNEPLSKSNVFSRLIYSLKQRSLSFLKLARNYFLNFTTTADREEAVPSPNDEEVGGDITVDLVDLGLSSPIAKDNSFKATH